jgi:hypothetical protein
MNISKKNDPRFWERWRLAGAIVKTCHDCGVTIWRTHLPGCDMEECPFCRNQLISCDCCYKYLGIDSSQEPVYSEGLNEEQEKQWEKILKKKGLILYGREQRFG